MKKFQVSSFKFQIKVVTALLAALFYAAIFSSSASSASSASSDEGKGPVAPPTVKVLIIDEGFTDVPSGEEKLTMLDRVNGSLVMGESSYRGDIEVWKGQNSLYLVNELPLEEYVEGVVAAETGKNWLEEALKAQAIVVRTYVLHQKMKSLKKKFDVTSSVLHQVYRGQNSDESVSRAVIATRGEILTYDGDPIEAFYHSTCGGRTEDAREIFDKSFPYLKAVTTSCKLSPYSIWARKIPVSDIEQAIGVESIRGIKIKTHTATGRVKEIAFETASVSKSLAAPELRRLLGWKRLPSTDFTVRIDGGTAVFEGKGYGHGVGLCQWSALEMAKAGKSYKDILRHFYPGTALEFFKDR